MSIEEKLTTIAENEQKVYEAGKQAEYDSFWDMFQQNGSRTTYNNAFSYGWDNKNFRPKYDIVPTSGCTSMFASWLFDGDLVEHLNELGIILDLSKATNTKTLFNMSRNITHIGVIDCSSSSDTTYMFYYNDKLETIDLLKLKEDGSQDLTGCFTYAYNLQNIKFEGVIGKNGCTMQWSTKLTKASITSAINALSATTSGLTITFSKVAVNNAFGINVDDPTTYPEGSEWYELRNSKSNWTISFA